MSSWPGRLVVALAFVVVVARIFLVPGVMADPDRSRFATAQSLLSSRSFSIGARIDDGVTTRDVGPGPESGTVDMMLDPESKLFFSSKPPLLATFVAAELWLMERLFGWSYDTHTLPLLRVVLLTFHGLPFLGYLLVLSWALARRALSPWLEAAVLAVAGLATFVAPFTSTLNNHALAACTAAVAAVSALEVFARGERAGLRWSLLAGFAAGATAALELPALSLVAATFCLTLIGRRAHALAFFLPAALLPMCAWLLMNALSFGDPFFFLHVPKEWYRFAGSYWRAPRGLDDGERAIGAYAFHFLVGHHGLFSLTPLMVPALLGAAKQTTAQRGAKLAVVVVGVLSLMLAAAVMRKDLHWKHYVSLLPAVLLGALPLLWPSAWWRRAREREEATARLFLACLLPTVTFYLEKTDNYGGITSGPRWLLWLTPLWVLALPSPLGALSRSALGKALVVVLFAVSLFSAWYGGVNPYRHPWLYDWLAARQ